MYMQETLYHAFLRTMALVLALVLLFDSGLLSPVTRQLSADTQLYLGQAVGMTATVSPNELNEITAALTEREQELKAREAALRAREIGVELNDGSAVIGMSVSTLVLTILVSILLVLIIINYILDFRRARRRKVQLA